MAQGLVEGDKFGWGVSVFIFEMIVNKTNSLCSSQGAPLMCAEAMVSQLGCSNKMAR